ncbi:hypothetical protein GGI07_001191 [Coemansia sp. Benny D115]|nr:hypothetical protein GGI07_001191 [Coemansia sp. Benny D115]
MAATYSPSSEDTYNQWLFSKEDLLNTPSENAQYYSTPPDGKQSTPAACEPNWRTRGCTFIHNVVKRLDLHQIVASTACVFFHRFYMRQSVANNHQYQVAGACVLLATKVEEHKRSLKEVAKACAAQALKGDTSKFADVYEKWQRILKRMEISVLENCCFDLDIVHPYVFIDTLAMDFGIPVFVARSATAHVNDTMRSTICLLYRPQVVAVAALYFAMSVRGYGYRGGNLLEARNIDISLSAQHEVEACLLDILDFYNQESEAEKEAFRRTPQRHTARTTPREAAR